MSFHKLRKVYLSGAGNPGGHFLLFLQGLLWRKGGHFFVPLLAISDKEKFMHRVALLSSSREGSDAAGDTD